MNQIDQVTQQNAAMVEQTGAVSQVLAGEVHELVRLTKRFKVTDPTQSGRSAPVSPVLFGADPAPAARIWL